MSLPVRSWAKMTHAITFAVFYRIGAPSAYKTANPGRRYAFPGHDLSQCSGVPDNANDMAVDFDPVDDRAEIGLPDSPLVMFSRISRPNFSIITGGISAAGIAWVRGGGISNPALHAIDAVLLHECESTQHDGGRRRSGAHRRGEHLPA